MPAIDCTRVLPTLSHHLSGSGRGDAVGQRGKWGAEESIWAESSFSTTAALTGGVPILTLRTRGHRCSGQRKRRFLCSMLRDANRATREVPDTFALGQAASFASTVRNLATTKGWRKRKGGLDDDSPAPAPARVARHRADSD